MSIKKLVTTRCKSLSELEEQLAQVYYGLSFDELTEDEQGEISMDAHDILGY